MQVKIYDLANGHDFSLVPIERLAPTMQCDVSACFPSDPEELAIATKALDREGQYLVGGGAAPLILLVKV